MSRELRRGHRAWRRSWPRRRTACGSIASCRQTPRGLSSPSWVTANLSPRIALHRRALDRRGTAAGPGTVGQQSPELSRHPLLQRCHAVRVCFQGREVGAVAHLRALHSLLGTVFVSRHHRPPTQRAPTLNVREAPPNGVQVMLFPEGTTSNGSHVRALSFDHAAAGHRRGRADYAVRYHL